MRSGKESSAHRQEARAAKGGEPTNAREKADASNRPDVQQLLDELHRERLRLEFLAEASSVLAGSLDYHTTLTRVAQLMVPRLADWCAVDMVEDDGRMRRVAVTHVDPRKVQWAMDVQKQYPPDLDAAHGVPQVLRSGTSELYSDITDQMLVEVARDARHLEILRDVGLKSAMIVPLVARGRTSGAISLYSAESGRRYRLVDLAYVEDIARRVALAVDNARLYQQAMESARWKDEAMALLDALLATAPVGMAFLDRELRFVRINAAMAAIAESTPQAAIGCPFAQILPELERQIGPHLRQVLASGRPALNLEASAGGEPSDKSASSTEAHRDFLVSCYPVCCDAAEALGVGMVVTDITTAKRSEAELARAKEQAEAANAAKDQFLAVLSHELRTPLTPVLAMASRIEKAPADSSSLRESMRMIRRNVELEARLIDDLLDLTRIEHGTVQLRLETVDVHEIVRHAVEISQDAIRGKQLRLSMELSAQQHHVQGDASRLGQVFWNLINNAVKFTPVGGWLALNTVNETPQHIRLNIMDSGIGMSADLVPRLFRAFEQGEHQSARRFGGLGLGLAISKALVDAHGGTLTAASRGANQGSTLAVTLKTVPAPEPAPPPQAGQPDAGRRLRILLVEDHEDTLRIMSRLLRSLGHQVTTAGTVAQALAAARDDAFDLLISDIGLPDGNGADLMSELRRITPIPGIALSGFGMDQDIARSRAAGFSEHLTKPISFEHLEHVLQRLSEGKTR